jgi:hypothetical protein
MCPRRGRPRGASTDGGSGARRSARGFTPLWGIHATVEAFEQLQDAPNDYHPVVLFGEPDDLLGQLEFKIGDVKAARLVGQLEGAGWAGSI